MKVAVVGDTLMDIDVTGHAGRLCPDAPAPVIDVAHRQERAGGAGLVATMLADDGHEVELLTALSDDHASERLRALLDRVHLSAGELQGPTPVKMRVTADGQRIARIDEGCGPRPFPLVDHAMLDSLADAGAIVVADYGRRLADDPTMRAALEDAARHVPVVWDPHPQGAPPISHAAAVTPNLPELLAFSGRAASGLDAVASAAGKLRLQWKADSLIVTLAERGALVCGPDADTHIAAPSTGLRIEDSCGAGDRFAASLAVALADGKGIEAAVEAAVSASASFLARGGVSSLGAGSLTRPPAAADGAGSQGAARLVAGPSAEAEEAPAFSLARRVQSLGGRVVAAGGCFDLLHAGHLRLLEAARDLGDCLIVCVNSDDSIRRLKGESRPLMSQQDRVELLLGLSCVDAVEVFAEDTPEQLLRELRPDIWVKGADYEASKLPETQLLRRWGGEVVTIPLEPGRSTTGLATAIASLS
ncbi:PfkB family carbohydrate kinase [Sinomonas notoginsengisoli]|uniref:D-glycero-beta-D-manno-heptose 1-phosphate adenylyltransferase n=1 Tax=Sinomonas notoginsengisoli TaxID=1457311 RepID=UPI001F3D823C|nr:D-glycero-beta-D-manno-heptose 1-phosphate adenylyltransferase [Sinomonas notoginsengisoli]